MPVPKRKILYDENCELCKSSIRFIANHGGGEKFEFLPLQSKKGRKELERHGLPGNYDKSVLLAEESQLLSKSDAVLAIMRDLDRPWSGFYHLRRVPRPVRDFFYNIVSGVRHTKIVQRLMKS